MEAIIDKGGETLGCDTSGGLARCQPRRRISSPGITRVMLVIISSSTVDEFTEEVDDKLPQVRCRT